MHFDWSFKRWNEELEKFEKLLEEIDLSTYVDEIKKLRKELNGAQNVPLVSKASIQEEVALKKSKYLKICAFKIFLEVNLATFRKERQMTEPKPKEQTESIVNFLKRLFREMLKPVDAALIVDLDDLKLEYLRNSISFEIDEALALVSSKNGNYFFKTLKKFKKKGQFYLGVE